MNVVSICSARPNFVKLAAIHHAITVVPDITHRIIHTGQHHDPLFSDVFFKELNIPQPDVNLEIHGGTNEEQQKRVEEALRASFSSNRPDLVMVYGDVNGAVAAARAAHGLQIPLAHIEAGLRSGDLSMPEEHNRIAIDTVADLLFVTEQSGIDHLKQEKVKGKAFLVGNTMIDTLVRMMPKINGLQMPIKMKKPYGVITLHRPSNVDDQSRLTKIAEFLSDVSSTIPLIFPIHIRTTKRIDEWKLGDTFGPNIRMENPLPYLEFLRVIRDAAFVLTDSGGIQEETTYLKIPCFTLRPNTERPATITVGSNRLVDLDRDADRQMILDCANGKQCPSGGIPELWDGDAGKRIVDLLLKELPKLR
jgi:UDP-N-acetylglucosamine 2-epimerase (non-hydrolysing)